MEFAGKKINDWYLIGGGAAVIGGYLYWKHEANSAASSANTSSASSTTTGIDPLTGMPYSEDNSVDPLTGMTYLQEAQEYGSVSAAQAALSSGANGYDAGGYGGYGDTGYPYPSTSVTSTQGQTYTTNAQWAQAVQAGLVGLGYSAKDVASALGLFFAQHPLSASEANIIQVAIGEYGPPPQGTYQIIPDPTKTGGGTVTVPDVVGGDLATAQSKLSAAGLTFKKDPTAAKAGQRRMVTAQNPKSGSKVKSGTYVDMTWVDKKID